MGDGPDALSCANLLEETRAVILEFLLATAVVLERGDTSLLAVAGAVLKIRSVMLGLNASLRSFTNSCEKMS